MIVQPYLSFDGRCEEAIEFYKTAVGAKVEMLVRFKESPVPPPPGQVMTGMEEKVMHSSLRIGDSVVMATDGQCSGTTGFSGFSLSLTASTDAEVARSFEALSDGGKVTMPLAKTFFSSNFGVVVDRFGVSWMVMVTQ